MYIRSRWIQYNDDPKYLINKVQTIEHLRCRNAKNSPSQQFSPLRGYQVARGTDRDPTAKQKIIHLSADLLLNETSGVKLIVGVGCYVRSKR